MPTYAAMSTRMDVPSAEVNLHNTFQDLHGYRLAHDVSMDSMIMMTNLQHHWINADPREMVDTRCLYCKKRHAQET